MSALRIPQIHCGQGNADEALIELRRKLSPAGDVVSEAGRQRTLAVFGEPLSPQQVVERIRREVREQGLRAVLDYSRKLDRAELSAETLRVPADELAAAHAKARPEFLAAIRRIRENILRFQTAILHRDVRVPLPGGGWLMQRYVPLERVGICVPGDGRLSFDRLDDGRAVQAAGVRELAVVAPPTKYGSYNPDLLATCHELGITEVYRLGGAQGVAALAYGAAPVRKVDKIVGPGNLFVALAKQHVFGQVDIDSIAGPSEVIVLADDTARPDHIAADLIAQAEHSPGASILVTWSASLITATVLELERQLAAASRGGLARESLESFGALILARDADEACLLTDRFAPEHLHLAARDPESLLAKIPHAGAVFLGPWSPVAVGDYAAGPSHVLPTSGTARFASGLSSNSFLRSHSVLSLSPADLLAAAPDVQMLADVEGLDAHRTSVDIRLESARQDISPDDM